MAPVHQECCKSWNSREGSPRGVFLLHRFSREELEELDAEGRCVITDHGEFVLFNLYLPAISSEEASKDRFPYKMRFLEVGKVWAPARFGGPDKV